MVGSQQTLQKALAFVSLQGAIYAARRHAEPPFSPPRMSSYLDLTDNMAYAFISSYLLNTGLYAAWANNELRINVTHDRVSWV